MPQPKASLSLQQGQILGFFSRKWNLQKSEFFLDGKICSAKKKEICGARVALNPFKFNNFAYLSLDIEVEGETIDLQHN